MSWLTELTSKAENFLNKIDETAATTLQVEKTALPTPQIYEIKKEATQGLDSPVTPAHLSSTFPHSALHSVPPSSRSTGLTVSADKNNGITDVKVQAARLKPMNSSQNGSLYRSTSSPSLPKDDDVLFEFLNSANSVTKQGHNRNLSGPRHVPPPYAKVSLAAETQDVEHESGLKTSTGMATGIHPSEDVQVKLVQEPSTQATESLPNLSKYSEPVQQHMPLGVEERLSGLELENKLLRNEVRTVNEELESAVARLKKAQEEADSYRKRYENRRSQQNEDYERMRGEFLNRELDLNEALKAKDSQLAVLRVRIQEADSELKFTKESLSQLRERNESMLKDHSDATGVHSGALDSLRAKLEENEALVQKQESENESVKAELINLRYRMESEQQQYAETMRQLQSRIAQDKEKFRELEQSAKNAQELADNCEHELKEYKDKAARILQAKEKLITSLKQGSKVADVSPAVLTELEEVKQDRDMIRDELQQSKYKLEQVRQDYLDMENQSHAESEEMQERLQHLQHVLEEEKRKREHADEDMKRYMQELHHAREDFQRHKRSSLQSMQDKENEIELLKKQLVIKTPVSSSQEELENRIRTLTDSLIQKQTVVEALSTEKNSLVLQLERLEKQYSDVQSSLTRRNKELHESAHDLETADYGHKIQPMSSIMPAQLTSNLRWRSTVNEIDKFSVRLGVFLRRYPIARLMVIVYMFLLHLWVTCVILTYSPEMHPKDLDKHS